MTVGPLPNGVWRALRTFVEPHALCTFIVFGDPVPKGRPRIGKGGHAFTPKATKDAEKVVRRVFSDAMPDWEPEPDRTYGALVEFHTTASSKVDLDNAVKLVWDALNGVFWEDDVQVGDSYLRLVRGDGEPRAEVLLFAVEDNGTPKTRECETGCGTRFRSVSDKLCAACRKNRAAVRELLAGAVEDDLVRDTSRAFNFILGQSAAGKTPTYADVAIRLGTSEPRARRIVQSLISAGRLTKDGRKYTVPRTEGAA